MGGERERTEDVRESAMAHIKTARKGPEGRHDQACAVARETAPADGAPAASYAGDRMEVTGNLALGAGWFVAKNQAANRKRSAKAAADAGGWIGVVISGKPDPIAPTLQPRKRRSIARSHAGGTLTVMKAVAERDHRTRGKTRNHDCYSCQGRCGIVRRQQNAARGKARSFLQMQIGDDEDPFLGPIQRAVAIHGDRHVSDRDFRCRCLLSGSRLSTGSGISVQRVTPSSLHCLFHQFRLGFLQQRLGRFSRNGLAADFEHHRYR
jgi:hypothetical protein